MTHLSKAIEIENLTRTFGLHYALNKINLSLEQGEFLAIFGPNGAGKTTLIRILSTITKASSGRVTVSGLNLDDEAHLIRREIGVIAHQTFLYEELTAEENLRFYGKLYGIPKLASRLDEVLAQVGLQVRRHDRVRTFSRGMQQRLSIARAMLHKPKILLLDEPYTGLDQHSAEMLSGWLRQLRTRDRTILMVTHNLEKGLELADRVAILLQGRLVFCKPMSEVKLAGFRQTYHDLVESHGKENR